MFSFILFTIGWNSDKKEFDMSLFSTRTNAGFRSLFRLIYSPKSLFLIQIFWTFTWSKKTIEVNKVGRVIERRRWKDDC